MELQLDVQRLGGQVLPVDDFGAFPGTDFDDNASDATAADATAAERKKFVRHVWGHRWSGRAAMSRRQLHLLRLTQYRRVAFVSHQMYFSKNLDDKVGMDRRKQCSLLFSQGQFYDKSTSHCTARRD